MLARLFALACALTLAGFLQAGDDDAKEKGRGQARDPEKLFQRLDTNGDGKITKEEFKAAMAKLPGGKLKDKPELIDRIFNRLDANGDGGITLEEFKKLSTLRGQASKGNVDPEKLKKLKDRFQKPNN